MKRYTIELKFEDGLPPSKVFLPDIRRAPKRSNTLSESQKVLAVANALRYIPKEYHSELLEEFIDELNEVGRIYGYRFRPEGPLFGKPIDQYEGECLEGKAFQVMIDNNLDFQVALYPYELVTYGESGSVFQNWMQYLLVKEYLKVLRDDQTLFIASGHPIGLFDSHKEAPRVILTNGLMVGMFDRPDIFANAAAMGVANYGQMTAGGWMYIGPQGIVHGTYNTLLNAGRLKLGLDKDDDLRGKLFVSSGLGGMSGAQGKAIVIAKGVGIIAEVDVSRIKTRHSQGWVDEVATTCEDAFMMAHRYISKGKPRSIAYVGNIVDLLEYATENDIRIDLLSDQTSCHDVYNGGYCPVGITFDERTRLLKEDQSLFKTLVDSTLRRHYLAIKKLIEKGTYFFDYGNAFLKSLYDSGISEISKNGVDDQDGFIWPSYVEDILGPHLFDYGYGPFRWVCLSGKDEDLDFTDAMAMKCIDPTRRYQDKDNYDWIKNAKANHLVVGTKARILYQDAYGRLKIALAFNEMVRNQQVGPIMLGRDHHDTGGTDSPFRETSNIKDGSNIMADMATLIYAGNSALGMSLVALHNGGGVGVSKSINGGFGLVLDGSKRVDEILQRAMIWDVMGGVARRSWATNPHAIETSEYFNESLDQRSHITIPYVADMDEIRKKMRKTHE
jgi:urocanate hydratase